uniref:Uncharacterized protein n=1 Tax=Amphimedon queenslandica TaxID=400682 RepID=A0A1X7SZE0_AMPQE
ADSGDVRLETAESQIKLQKTKHELETAALEETIKEKDCEICVLQEKFETLERELDKSKHELLLLKEDKKQLQ